MYSVGCIVWRSYYTSTFFLIHVFILFFLLRKQAFHFPLAGKSTQDQSNSTNSKIYWIYWLYFYHLQHCFHKVAYIEINETGTDEHTRRFFWRQLGTKQHWSPLISVLWTKKEKHSSQTIIKVSQNRHQVIQLWNYICNLYQYFHF